MVIDFPLQRIYVFKSDMVQTQVSPVEIYSHNFDSFYKFLMEQQDTEDGRVFPVIVDYTSSKVVGGTPLAASMQIVGDYVVQYEAGNYIVDQVGMNTNVSSVTIANGVSVRPQNTAGLTDVSVLTSASYSGRVVFSSNGNAQTGTSPPIGTFKIPSNNIQDAVIIADAQGVNNLHLVTSVSLSAGDDVSGMTLRGASPTRVTLDILDAANVYQSEFEYLKVSGVLDGQAIIRECLVDGLDYVTGFIEHSGFTEQVVVLGANSQASYINCFSNVAGSATPTTDMGGSGQSLAIRGYNGGIRITNRTGADQCSIDMASGHVIIDATCTGDPIIIRGTYKLTVEAGATQPDTEGRTAMISTTASKQDVFNAAML